MAVSLVKGGNVSLTKEAPSMNVALVGWAGMHALLMVRHLIWMHQYSLLAKTVKCCPIRISYFITTPPARMAQYSIRVTTVPVKATVTMSRSKLI